jgi:capsular exopolysaccharide synthesis family protein
MSANGTSDTIDLKAIFRKVTAKWWLFLITVPLAGALGVAYLKTTPKLYQVKAVLRMSEGRRSSFGASKEEFLKGSGYLKTDAELEDEITMIKSVGIMSKTLSRLDFSIGYYETRNFLTRDMYDSPPFIVRLDSTDLQMCGIAVHVKVDTVNGTFHVKAKGKNVLLYDLRTARVSGRFLSTVDIEKDGRLGEPFAAENLRFTLTVPPGRQLHAKADHYFVLYTMDDLIRQWEGTSVSPMSETSNILTLTTMGEVVSKQVKFLDMLMYTYIESEKEQLNKKGQATIDFIDQALNQSSQELQSAQAQLQVAQSGGMMGEASAQVGAINQELFQQQREESRLRSMATGLQNLIATISMDAGGTPTTIAASDINAPSLNNLIDKYNSDVARLRADELNIKIPTAPIIALRRTVQTERDQIIQSAQSLAQQTQTELAATRQMIGQLQGRLYALPGQESRRQSAARTYELTESIHNYLMEKSYEAQIAVNSDQVDKSVVDAAREGVPGPVAPNKKGVLAISVLMGILLPLMFILVRDFFNDRIADVEELKRVSPIPVLATIPSSRRKRVSPDEPKSLLAESFRTARINLQYLNARQTRQVVGLTSSTSGEGKTFCAINLASVMAMSGKRTILIDADMRRPRVHEYLELPEATAGLSTLLIGDCTLDQAVRRTDIPGLDVITAGPVPPNPLELVESKAMTDLFQTLRGRYDQVVVDASPMGLVGEFKIMVGHVDVTLYVVRQGYSRRGMLRGINELYREGKIAALDLVLNDVKGDQGYGYGYYTK